MAYNSYGSPYNFNNGLIGPPQAGSKGGGPGPAPSLNPNDFYQSVLQLLNGGNGGTPPPPQPGAISVFDNGNGGLFGANNFGTNNTNIQALMALVAQFLSSQGMSFDPFGGAGF